MQTTPTRVHDDEITIGVTVGSTSDYCLSCVGDYGGCLLGGYGGGNVEGAAGGYLCDGSSFTPVVGCDLMARKGVKKPAKLASSGLLLSPFTGTKKSRLLRRLLLLGLRVYLVENTLKFWLLE